MGLAIAVLFTIAPRVSRGANRDDQPVAQLEGDAATAVDGATAVADGGAPADVDGGAPAVADGGAPADADGGAPVDAPPSAPGAPAAAATDGGVMSPELPALSDTSRWVDRLKIRGFFGPSGTYFFHNAATPIDPTGDALPPSRWLGRTVLNLRGTYAPTDSGRSSLAGEGYFICSKQQDVALTRHSCMAEILDLQASFTPGDYVLIAGRRSALQSVGYFRYPLDFYDTRSRVTTGAEDPRQEVDSRTGEILVHAERRWDSGALSVEYVPELPNPAWFDWHTNAYNQFLQRLTLLLGGFGINLGASESIGRSQTPVLAGPILRDRNVVQVGGSVTYVIGEGLELHAEGSYRHDQRLPVANLAPLARPADAPPPAAPEFIWQPGGQAHLIQALGGGQYTFGGDSALRGLNVIAEYYYQNEGWTSADWNSYFTGFDIIKSVTSGQGPPPGSLDAGAKLVEFATTNAALMRYRPVYWGRHYGFLRLAKDDVPFPGVELSIFTVAAFPDWSLATGTAAVVNVHNLQVRLSARSYSGGAKTEFGRLPDRYLLQVDVYYVF